MKRYGVICISLAAVLLAGCVSSRSSEVYSRDQARRAQTVELGTVEAVKPIQIEGTKSGIGAIGGGIAGGVAGSTVGGGDGKRLATLGGALAGAAAGAMGEERLTRKEGLEIIVKLDNGTTMSVVQEADVPLYPGDRVRVITGGDGTTRVSR